MTTIVVNPSQRTSSIVVKKGGDLTLQSLKNVVTTDLDDGYSLLYDSNTNSWVSQPISNVSLNFVDGGTY